MNRRTFCRNSVALGLSHGLAFAQTKNPPAPTAIIDTHTHFYDPTRKQGVPWPTRGTSLFRPVYPRDWQKVAGPFGVTQTVVVEASPWIEDNQWILDLAENEPSVVGLIGNLDPSDSAFPDHLTRFARNPVFRGIRWRGDRVKADIGDETFNKRAGNLADKDMVLELNGGPSLLFQTGRIARAFPSLKIMVDHVGGAGDPKHITREWMENMKSLGDLSNVSLKVSALTEQTRLSNAIYGKSPRDVDYYIPILDQCWVCFGEKRLIYGSDWPVCEKGGSYSDQFEIAKAYFDSKGSETFQRVFRQNARDFYQLKK